MVDLCTLAEVKAWANVTTAGNDAMLTSLIANVSAFIRQYCSRDFDAATYTETRNGTGSTKLFLKNSPVTGVTSLTVDGYTIPLAASPTGNGYLFDANTIYLIGGRLTGSPVGAGGSVPGIFTRSAQNVRVVYTAGYTRAPTDALPGDLRQAAIDLCLLKFRRRQHPERAGEALAGQNLNYVVTELTEEIRGVLDRYKRVTPI